MAQRALVRKLVATAIQSFAQPNAPTLLKPSPMLAVMTSIPPASAVFCTAGGLKNNYIGTVNKSSNGLFRRQIKQREQGLPPSP